MLRIQENNFELSSVKFFMAVRSMTNLLRTDLELVLLMKMEKLLIIENLELLGRILKIKGDLE